MQRRQVIKSVALGFGSLLTLPAWANNWNKERIISKEFLSGNQENILAEIVETIIPETTTPGAKSLGVDKLIQKLVTDCYGKEAEIKLADSLNKIDALAIKNVGKSFTDLNGTERLDLLTSINASDNAELKEILKNLKGMTINGYTKSEYFMTNLTDYEFAPARFYGCVPVK